MLHPSLESKSGTNYDDLTLSKVKDADYDEESEEDKAEDSDNDSVSNKSEDGSYIHHCEHCDEHTFYSTKKMVESDENLKGVCLTDTCIEKAIKEYINKHL